MTLSRLLLLFFCLILLFSCNRRASEALETPPKLRIPIDSIRVNEEELVETEPYREYETIELLASIRKTTCHGFCPVFEINYYSNGRISYQGDKHVEKLGLFESWASEHFRSALNEIAEKYRFFSFEKAYPINGHLLNDLPATITYLQLDSHHLKVYNQYESPKALRRFEDELLSLFEQQNWKRVQTFSK